MPIPFACPFCGHATTVADQYAGSSGPCGRCGKTITIPSAPGGPVPVAASTSGATSTLQINCPFCGLEMQRGAILGDRYALKWQPADQPKVLGIWSTGHTIGVKGLLTRPTVSGFRCAACQKIVVSG